VDDHAFFRKWLRNFITCFRNLINSILTKTTGVVSTKTKRAMMAIGGSLDNVCILSSRLQQSALFTGIVALKSDILGRLKSHKIISPCRKEPTKLQDYQRSGDRLRGRHVRVADCSDQWRRKECHRTRSAAAATSMAEAHLSTTISGITM
jgi:hypothetical protein